MKRPFGRGTTPLLDLLTMLINYLDLLSNWDDPPSSANRFFVSICNLRFFQDPKWRNKQVSLTIIQQPATQTTSSFEGQPLKTTPFPTKRRVTWVPRSYLRKIFKQKQRGGVTTKFFRCLPTPEHVGSRFLITNPFGFYWAKCRCRRLGEFSPTVHA